MHEKWLGIVLLARVVDKAKAKAAGTLGEYVYDSPIDQALFAFLGMNAEDLFSVVASAASDDDIEAYVARFIAAKPAEEIERWNRTFVALQPDGAEQWKYFTGLRDKVAPERTDVVAWADLFDLEEERSVPVRQGGSPC